MTIRDFVFKVVFVGPSMSGKSCLCCRWVLDTWVCDPSPTLGASYSLLRVPLDATGQEGLDLGASGGELDVELQLWDTAGQEIYRSLTPLYLRGCHAAVVVLDSTNPVESHARDLEEWVHTVCAASPGCLLFVAFSKTDLVPDSTVRGLLATFREYNGPSGRQLHAVSSKTGTNTRELLDCIVRDLVAKHTDKAVLTLKDEGVISSRPKARDGFKKGCC